MDVEQHRPYLKAIAYRMLGSAADAEDIVQEAYVRWHTRTVDVETPRAYLATTTARLALNYLESARVRRETYVGEWLPEPVETANAESDLRLSESVSMAFLVLLEKLAPLERAIFVLHQVFDYDYAEVAAIVGKTETNCRQILARARKHIADHRPRFSAPGPVGTEVTRRFFEAMNTGNLTNLLTLLAEDCAIHADGGGKVSAATNAILGVDHVSKFLLGIARKGYFANAEFRFCELNTQPALVRSVDGRTESAVVVDVEGGRVRTIYIVRNPDKLRLLKPV